MHAQQFNLFVNEILIQGTTDISFNRYSLFTIQFIGVHNQLKKNGAGN